MVNYKMLSSIESILIAIESLVPEYMAIPADAGISDGNVAICIIDEEDKVHGKMFGSDKLKQRQSFTVAWRKASQAWITGMKTGEYEKMVFNGIIDYHKFGIPKPEFIGWDGGQPVTLTDGTKLSIGFSGFRGISDVEIVIKAIAKAV